MNMTAKVAGIAVAAALAATGAAAAQEPDGFSEQQVRDALAAQGYTAIEDVERDDGLWEAEARREDGRVLDLRIDPRTGAIYPEDGTTTLAEADVQAALAAAGYSRVHDVDFDDGLWEAEAFDASGVEWQLYLDPRDAQIVGRKRD